MVKRKHRKHWNLLSRVDVVYNIIAYTVLIILFVLITYPLIYVVSASFTKAEDVISGKMWLFPTSFTLTSYQKIFTNQRIVSGFLNSLFYVIIGTVLSIICTFAIAYPLSRKDFAARRPIIKFLSVTLFFGGGLVPTFLLIKSIGMYNTRWALIIPSLISVWNVILVRTYFMSAIPDELLDAAKIDGCGNIRFLIQIVMPLAKPILAVLIMYNVLGRWNSYFDAMIYLDDATKYPLQLILRQILINNDSSVITGGSIGGADMADQMNAIEGMKYAVMVVSSIPMIIVCFFTQKYFKKGALLGSMKG